MPIYEYRCAACGHELEALQKLADPPLKDCPACGQSRLSKLVSAAGFRLKGSGWYATDFKQGSKTAAKTAEKTNGESSKSEPAAAAADGAAAKPSAGEAKPAANEAKAAASEAKPASKPGSGGESTH